jgi:hypothetical protein
MPFLGEPLVGKSVPSWAQLGGKANLLLLLSFLTGFGCVVLLRSQVGGKPGAHLELAVTSAGQSMKMRQPTMPVVRAWQPMLRHSLQPLRAEAGEPAVEAGGSTVAVAEAPLNSLQEKLKKVSVRREKTSQGARFPVKALRRITAQGADVPVGTSGTIEAGLIRWDDGSFSEDQTVQCLAGYRPREELQEQCVGLGQDYMLVKIPELTVKKETVKKIQEKIEGLKGELAGITAPMGYFDPLGFSTNCKDGKLLFYREVELKHGRVGMLAALGIVVGERFHPLFGGNIDNPAYTAFQETPLQTFWPVVVAAIAIPEVFSIFSFDPAAGTWMIKTDRIPGDLKWDPLGLKPTNPKEFKEMQTKELNNGRLAMIAAAGMIAQELATGQKLFA